MPARQDETATPAPTTTLPRFRRPSRERVSVHSPVLGTVLELRITTTSRRAAAQVEHRAVDEFARLESIFSVFDPDSDLSRWRRGAYASRATPELDHLLAVAADWAARTRGAFNPMAGAASALWRESGRRIGDSPPIDGESTDGQPTDAQLKTCAHMISTLPYRRSTDGSIERTGDCRYLDLNAIAKGYIVDAVAGDLMVRGGVRRLVVNCGGDLVHRGEGTVTVGVEHPLRAYDNAEPWSLVELGDQAMATSGMTRRGFAIGGRRYGHVIDPRTARPVDLVASATVIAPDAITADVLATALAVLPPSEGVALASDLDGVAAAVIDRDGRPYLSRSWSRSAPPSRAHRPLPS